MFTRTVSLELISRTVRRWLALLLASLAVAQAAPAKLGAEWPTATPEAYDLSGPRLEGAWRGMLTQNTTTLLVIRSDHVVFERYVAGYSRTTPHFTASLAKALVGGMSLMVAMADGRIRPEDPASRYVPAWRDDPVKKDITVAQLATHTSGLDDANEEGIPHSKLPGWKGEFWKFLPVPRDPFTLSRDVVPVMFKPGTRSLYSNPGLAMLGYCVTASLQGSPYRDLDALLRERVMNKIGVPANEWSVGYSGPVQIDGLSLTGTWGGANFSPNAAARVGRLLARRGDWDEEQVLPFDIVTRAIRHAGLPNASGLSWWVNRNPDGSRVLRQAPDDTFWGLGASGQLLLVIPSLDLIVVRNGGGFPPGVSTLGMVEKFVINPVLEAFIQPHANPPYPPSPVISRIDWAPADSVVHLAPGGDNWASTWGDDDALYTAYGDGNGFAPFTAEKLSLGFARITGSPPAVSPTNLRSLSGEQTGDGRKGRKASGLLMVDGVLYLLARNADNAQLAWSADHGATWQWSDWKFQESFGCPAFVNFGKNYAGARDNYVYLLSPDANTAYQRADRLVMARVPRDRLRDRDAYEFFVRRDEQGNAHWSRNVADRGGFFENPGACYRSHMTYHPGLKRYLLTTIGRGADTRYAGGFGVYDAPEPWGPWTTAFFTDTWDVGPGESNQFPTKWLGTDGSAWLLFSGEDAFSLRRATFVTAPAR